MRIIIIVSRIKWTILFSLLLLTSCGWQFSSTRTFDTEPKCGLPASLDISYNNLKLEGTPSVSGPQVAALAFESYQQYLQVAYAIETPDRAGQLVDIEIPSTRILQSIALEPIIVGFTHISRDTTRIVSAAPTECTPEPWLKNSKCWNIIVWLTETGQLASVPRPPASDLHDVAISPDGKWLFTAESGAGIQNVEKRFSGSGLGIHREDQLDTFEAVAFNRTGNLIAYGMRFEDLNSNRIYGSIGIKTWDGEHIDDLTVFTIGNSKISVADANIDEVPVHIAIDSNDHWFAVQTAATLEIRGLSNLSNRKGSVKLDSTSGGVVEFNPSSSLLAVGYTQGLKVLRVPDLKTVLDRPGAHVTSVAFSKDGCLLAWGDMGGTVHIINVPRP